MKQIGDSANSYSGVPCLPEAPRSWLQDANIVVLQPIFPEVNLSLIADIPLLIQR